MTVLKATMRWTDLKPREDDPTPLYIQLAHKIADAINAGRWQADQALPSERILSDKLGISRVTARKALDMLVDQGLIHRRHGSGTFISRPLEQPLSRLTNFTEMLASKGYESSTVWLERGLEMPTYDEVMKLGISTTTQVARLQRLRLADGVVMAVEMSTLPAQVLPDPLAVESSLYAYLDRTGHRVVRALQHIRAVN